MKHHRLLKRKCLGTSISTYLFLICLGIIWLVVGVYVAISQTLAPKISPWEYIVAWILFFGIPAFMIFNYAFKKLRINYRKVKGMTAKSKKKQVSIKKAKSDKLKNFTRKNEITHVENVYTISPRTQQYRGKSHPCFVSKEKTEKHYRCAHCNSIISEDAYERYRGLCYGCYIDKKRDLRRSGLLGADRASTW